MAIVLDKEDSLAEDDIAFLILHYTDDISLGSDWARYDQIGTPFNATASNPIYRQLNEEGDSRYKGVMTF